MTGAYRMARLDFYTLKHHLVSYLSLFLIVLLFGFMGSSITLLCINAAWFVALMSSNIFAIQEKNNLDRLYSSVSVGLRDIVLGRYVSVFLNYFLAVVAIIALYISFSVFQHRTVDLHDLLMGISLSFLVYSAITGVQMPLYFKLGYTKARIWGMIPFMAVMALVALPSFVPVLAKIVEFMAGNPTVLILGAFLVGVLIQFISYQFSVIAYRKRR